MSGRLYIVPTPVGNLDDMTPRAVQVLQQVSVILAEDTRTSAVLMKHYGITTPMRSHHKFNEHDAVPAILLKTLQQLADVMGGEREASVSREISKIHNTTHNGTLAELVDYFTAVEPRGEIVIVVAGCEQQHAAKVDKYARFKHKAALANDDE